MIEELLKELATQGLLGVLLVIIGIGYYKKDEKLSCVQSKRLEDMMSVKDQYTELITKINSTLDRLVSLLQNK